MVEKIDFNVEEVLKERKEILKQYTNKVKDTEIESDLELAVKDVCEAFINVAKGESRIDIQRDSYKVAGYFISGQDTIRIDVRHK
jgi:hypothetical protein